MAGAGATVGFLFTPVNWKIMDDGAIWTQNWPWVPIPEDGETTYATSTCKLCPGACGIKVRLIDAKRAIKIEGDPGHPVNKGAICPLGLSGLQVIYGPDRIKGPMKRAGERGSGEWKAISWGQAMSELSAKLSEQRNNGRPQSVALISGERSGTMRRFWERFLRSYGSPNLVTMPALADSEEAIGAAMHGVRRPMGYDLENARYVMSFGAELIDGWGGPRSMRAYGMWRSAEGTGAKWVHVSTGPSMSSSKACEWVAVAPGTEAALALGMANVILGEGLARGSGAGVDSFRAMAAQFTPDTVSGITGVPADVITRLAREFATTSQAVAVWGRGKGEMPERLSDAAAVQCLNGLVGAVGATGGVAPQPSVPITGWGEAPVDSTAASGLAAGRLDGAAGVVESLAHDFLAAAVAGEPYQINVLMVYEANPAYALANAGLYRSAAKNIPYVVSFATSMDETAAMADLILPNPSYLERWDSTLNSPGCPFPVASLTRPVIGTLYDTKPTAEVMTEVAKSVGGSVAEALPWGSAEEMVKSEVGALVGEGTFWADEAARGPAGLSFTLNLPGGSVVPRYQSADWKGSANEYPLLLMPHANARITQHIANPPYMTKTLEDWVLKKQDLFVAMSPRTAKDAGLCEDDAVEVETPRGKVSVRAHLDKGMAPGVVEIPLGFGHTVQSKWIAGKGVNANEVLDVERDPLSGLARWAATRARIIKV
jgi:anaerobic selenocysteine-containing dehydrogenase